MTLSQNTIGYDIIGDIHGHAKDLENLLEKLGYSLDGDKHPKGRKVIYIGDFIDRGPNNRRVLNIAKKMVESNTALAVMGNHEYNAICYHTKHPTTRDFLRRHSDKNTKQHQAFLNEYSEATEETETVIKWFMDLPLFLEIDGLRIVHACWDYSYINELKPLLKEGNRLTDELLLNSCDKDLFEYKVIETLLKGPELQLPGNISYKDADGNRRNEIRVKWWKRGLKTYRELGIIPPESINLLPEDPLPKHCHDKGYPEDAPPVFFGHYWMREEDDTIGPNTACLDYSIAKGGRLACYRWNVDERNQALSKSKVISVKCICERRNFD